MTLSIIVPAYNEEGSISEVINRALRGCSLWQCEVIVVDDGSTDNTVNIVKQCSANDRRVTVLEHKKNLGKTAAVKTAMVHAKGEIIALIDADLQYDPSEIPKLIQPIARGEADIVNGWRVKRSDSLTRRLASRAYNWLVRRLFHVKVKDNNSGFKAFRKEVLNELAFKLRGELHRFVIPLAHYEGYRVIEVPISHKPRLFGKAKYASISRLMTGLMDIIALKLALTFQEKPMRLFGSSGGLSALVGLIIGIYLLYWKFVLGLPLTPRLPLLLLASLLIIVGLLLFLLGFLAEMIASLREEIKRRK